MSQKHSTMEDLLKKSKWITSEGEVTHWPEFAKDMGWITEAPVTQFGRKAKQYLPDALRDLGCHPFGRAFFTDDCPLKEGDSSEIAILTDKQGAGNCYVRMVRIGDGQIFVTSPLWPHAEVPFPLDYFKSIERVFEISCQ